MHARLKAIDVMTPNISVIIRTIWRPSLRRAIESVERQNRSDVEIVVVAARPGLGPVDSRLCAIHWLPTEVALHRCTAANIGLAAAQGEYLIFLDDDDWFESGHLDKLADALEKSPHAVAAHTGVRMQSETGECLAEFDSPFEHWQLMAMPRFPIHAVLFRRSVVEAGRCQFDAQFDVYEDWDFWLQLQKVGPFVHVPGVSAVYLHSAAGSGAHSVVYGDVPYQKLWQKWCGLYDASWLASLFAQVNQLPSMQQQLDAKRTEVAHLTSEVAKLTSEAAAARDREQSLRSEVAQLTSETAAARDREQSLRSEVAQLTSEAAAARDREQSLRASFEKVAADLHLVLNSRSWRLTAVLRYLARKLRHFKKIGRPQWAEAIAPSPYARWIAQHDTITAVRQREILAEIAHWQACPVISVAMPAYNPPVHFLRPAIDSVLAQIYPHWELCIADDASTDPKVREVLSEYSQRDARIHVVYRLQNGHIVEASNSALGIATGDFVALLDHDDLLPADALFEVAKAIRNHPDAGVIYSDEDKLTEDGKRFGPYFKPDYNYELLLGQNMISHLGVYRRTLLQDVGGFKAGMEGSQDHDLVLRCIERLEPTQVIHVPKVLYHWRVHGGSAAATIDNKPYALTAGIRAVNEHLDRTCPGATARLDPEINVYRVQFPLPNPVPKVSIILPTHNASERVRVCLSSLFQQTRYPAFEVIVVDNGSDEPALLDYLDSLARAGKITVLRDDGPFNYAALVNRGVAQSAGEFVLLLNSDIEITEPGWLEEMMSVAARPGVGAVGARLWYPDRTLQHGGVIVGLGGVAGHAHRGLPFGNPGYFGRAMLLQSMSAVTGACLLIRRSIYVEVGGLDENNLPLAFNDIDFCLKIARAGYRNVWTPHAQLVTHEPATRGTDFAPEKATRFPAEIRFMQQKWRKELLNDPAFNINLSLYNPHFVLGDAPRDPAGSKTSAVEP